MGSENHANLRAEADAIAEIATRAADVKVLETTGPESGIVAAVPHGTRLESLKPFFDEYRLEPERRKGTARFSDLRSFIAHANRFKDEHSVLFANPDPTAPSLTSVLDYHRARDGKPRHGHHRGIYTFPLSEEWRAWKAVDGKQMGQTEFAEFIESRVLDIAEPGTAGEAARAFSVNLGSNFAGPAKLLELSRGLTVRTNARVTNAQNLATGEAQMIFETSHADESGAPLKVPGAFLVVLPVFRLGALYQLPVRLRYRVRDRSVAWFVELYRADRIFEDAFSESCDKAEKGTELPLYIGTPEA